MVTLRPVTEVNDENFRDIFLLQISEKEQDHSQVGEMDDILHEVLSLSNPNRIGLGIFSDDTPVGFIDYSPIAERKDYHIYHLLIDKKHRRRGYAETALRLLIAELCEKPDCHRITLNYMAFNDSGAIELYKKVGFVEQLDYVSSDDCDRFAVLTCTKQEVELYEEIAQEIRVAALERNKMGMFHYQVLVNANSLESVSALDFCRAVGVPDSFTTEFQKMLRVAKTMEEKGKRII